MIYAVNIFRVSLQCFAAVWPFVFRCVQMCQAFYSEFPGGAVIEVLLSLFEPKKKFGIRRYQKAHLSVINTSGKLESIAKLPTSNTTPMLFHVRIMLLRYKHHWKCCRMTIY